MRGRSLAVLMWKHLMVRKRRFIHTAVELASPLVFILLLFLFRHSIKPKNPPSLRNVTNIVRMTEERRLDDDISTKPRFLLYTPDTILASTLMDEVGQQFGFDRVPMLPNRSAGMKYKGYYAFTNESEIADFIKDMRRNEAIIVFEDMEGNDWPDRKTNRLTYTIRMQTKFNTYTYLPPDEVLRDHKAYGFDYDEFIRIQWAIDTSYIKIRSGNTVAQELTLQEFPYQASDRAETMAILCVCLFLFSYMSLFLVFVFMMSRLLEERATGIQELIQMVGVSTNTLGISHFLNVLPCGLVYAVGFTVLTTCGDNPIIEHSSGAVIFIAQALHFLTVIAMAMACSYLMKSTQYAVSISVLVYVVSWLPSEAVLNNPPSSKATLFTGILPHVPLSWLWFEILYFEQYNYGLTMANITSSHTTSTGPVLVAYIWMMVQSAIFFMLAWYLSHVCPGNYGQAKHWNFFCQSPYWTNNEIEPHSDTAEEEPIVREKKFFEDPPGGMDVGIRIENVSKFFPKQKALNNVSLDVYKGEITILLGHNGAGKTTLMSIITGMMSASEGRVFVNGMDSVKQRSAVRTQLGLCPQHNLFFSDLTVLEHAMFFTLLKGGTYKEARNSSIDLLHRLGISSKAKDRSAELSGGMKRRLQLACALAGGANVLVLDEPTSGLDVETRRELWDLLLSLRGERTVLLTTHFMEEADALGDRVAALHAGQLRCHATTMYLKKAIGTGYRLSFTTNGVPKDAAITGVVTSFVPDAYLKEKSLNSLSYNLPATGSANFPTLFTTLEDRKSELGIESIGVGVSTLEEVFLQLCSDTDTTFAEDEVDRGRIDPTYNKVKGIALYARQFRVLTKRQYKYIVSKIITFILLQAIIPILIIFVVTDLFNNHQTTSNTQLSRPMNLDLYAPMMERKVLYKIDTPGASLRSVNERYPDVKFIEVNNVADAILRTGKQSVFEYNKYIIGVELNETSAKALYTTVYRHAAPVAVNLLSNLIASQYLTDVSGRTITVNNHPISSGVVRLNVTGSPIKNPKTVDGCLIWSSFIVFIIIATNLNFAGLPCEERVSGSRHQHVMAGCPAALHWGCTLVCHAAACCVLLVLPTVLAALILEKDSTINQPDMLLILVLILMMGSLAQFAFMYIVTYHFAERMTGVVLVAILVVFGLITPAVKSAIGFFATDANIFVRAFLELASNLMPPHTFTVAAAKCVYVARLNALCNLNRGRCPNLVVADEGFDSAKCCAGENPKDYLGIDKYSPGTEILILLAQFIVYMIIVVLLEIGVFKCMGEKIFNMSIKNRATVPSSDEMVRAEAVYVSKEIALPTKQIEDAKMAMLVNDIHKNYYRVCKKSCYAVQGLSFSVKKGECFGLLGVNGAGKSTTFKMLTAEECPTKGDIYANGHYINRDKNKYLRSLGYCPQFFGLDSFQTGHDNLKLLLTLRGLDSKDVKSEVKTWIAIVGLEKYSHRKVSGYSGGCTRRLGAAAALSSGAPLTLLDEPTAGVDVAARRRVWSALRRSLLLQRSVVITSHSMDEMEALCSRIGIMSGGALRALGTPAELRARHATGHAVVIKVKHAARDEVDGAKSQIETLKTSLQSKFNCTLKDEHKTMLHYHINETMRYSDLFSELENLKTTFPSLVEDYSVTETTLEEVFLSFAKEHQNVQQSSTRNGIV